VFSWLVSESYDDKGNATSYEYKMENSQNVELSPAHECNRTEGTRRANRYLKRIKYGHRTPRQPNEDLSLRKDWVFEVVFDYGEHYTEDKHGYPTSVFLPHDQRHWPIRQDPFSVTAPVSRCAREKVVFDPWRHETWDVADTLTLEPQHDASGNAAQPYVALRHAAGHLTMIANPLADAIAKQFPAKYTI
jgi:hypothetical protein